MPRPDDQCRSENGHDRWALLQNGRFGLAFHTRITSHSRCTGTSGLGSYIGAYRRHESQVLRLPGLLQASGERGIQLYVHGAVFGQRKPGSSGPDPKNAEPHDVRPAFAQSVDDGPAQATGRHVDY